MRSGELARLVGVSPDTVRHYERLGLLRPPPRTISGYRDYPPQSAERVRLIRRAMAIGFSLSELRAILRIRDRGGVPCQRVRVLARSKLLQLKQQMKDQVIMRRQLERILRDWDARLAWTRKGQRAQLLENLPDGLVSGEARTELNAKQHRGGKKTLYANRNNFGISRHRTNRPRQPQRYAAKPH